MKKEELTNYWIDSSEIDFKAMENLFSSKDYIWALFLGHLVIEKLLKAIAANNNVEHIPKIHDLNKLAKISDLEPDNSIKDLFDIITSFNLEASTLITKKNFIKNVITILHLNIYQKLKKYVYGY